MAGLGVNIDHVATIREARKTIEPDPVWAAVQAQLGGASCITFHLRKDRRHISDRDAAALNEAVTCKLNMEMSLDEEIVGIALGLKPDQVSLVPENRQEVTTEGGLDVLGQSDRMREVTSRLRDAGILVSAFIEPNEAQIEASHDVGCDAVELHTGQYANVCLLGGREAETKKFSVLAGIRRGVETAMSAGLVVHGGHGLTYDNVTPIAAIPGFTEFNIGHSIVSRAVIVGMIGAVTEMRRLVERAS